MTSASTSVPSDATMSDAALGDAASGATAPGVPATPSDLAPERPPRASEEAARSLRGKGRAFRFIMGLPDPALDAIARRTQRPTKPSARIVDPALVTRDRIGAVDRTMPGVPVTWIDRPRAAQATVVHVHGGAFLAGESPAHWRWLEELRRRAGVAAAMVHYRMPPRSPYPAAVDDVVAVIRELVERAEVRDGHWVLSGDSAGGGVVLAALQRLRSERGPMPAGVLLTAPWTDLTLSDPQVTEAAERDEVLDIAGVRRAAARYAGGYALDDPRISPRLGSVEGLPPFLIVTGSDDMISGDARALAADLRAAAVPVVLVDQDGGQHDYPILTDDPAAQWALRRQVVFVREACGLRD